MELSTTAPRPIRSTRPRQLTNLLRETMPSAGLHATHSPKRKISSSRITAGGKSGICRWHHHAQHRAIDPPGQKAPAVRRTARPSPALRTPTRMRCRGPAASPALTVLQLSLAEVVDTIQWSLNNRHCCLHQMSPRERSSRHSGFRADCYKMSPCVKQQ